MNLKIRNLLLTSMLPLSGTAQAALTAYSPDANTTYLYHFDEPAGGSVAANAGTAGHNGITFDGTTYAGDGVSQPATTSALGATGFSGFGNAVNNTATTGIGIDLSGDGGFTTSDNSPVSPDRFSSHSGIIASSFTLEAMISVPSITGLQQEIISTDSFAGVTDRGFQFRINNTGNLEFNYIGSGAVSILTPIPTTGAHAFAPDEWFHVAAAYDGTDLSFYWTRVDASFTSANLLSTSPDTIDLADGGFLVIGNEARLAGATATTTAPLSNEGVVGLIDEVRISNIARGAGDFIFTVPEPSVAFLAGLSLLGLLVRRRK